MPPLEDLRFHRYDLLKTKMQMEDPFQPVLERVASTRQAGNRVWVVGPIPLDGAPPPRIRPAPNNPWRWLDDPYSQVWAAQVGYFIVNHAVRSGPVPEPTIQRVNPLENVRVSVVDGWKDAPPAPAAPSAGRTEQR